MLNGANSRMVSRITHKTAHEEASSATRTFDIVGWIRARRLQWVGHILRMDESRLIYQAAKYIADHRSEGDLLMDVPGKFSWGELRELAKDRVGWRSRVMAIRNAASPTSTAKTCSVNIIINPSLPGCKVRVTRSMTATTATHCKMISPSKLMAKRYKNRL